MKNTTTTPAATTTSKLVLKDATTDLLGKVESTPAKTTKKTSTVKKGSKNKTATKEPNMVEFFTNEISDTRYGNLSKNHIAFSAYTIAALIFAKAVVLTKAGTPTKARTKANLPMLSAIMGPSAFPNWKNKLGRIDENGITVKGVNEIQARMTGATRSYNTDLIAVNAMLKGITKGGLVEVTNKAGGTDKFNFNCSNKVSA